MKSIGDASTRAVVANLGGEMIGLTSKSSCISRIIMTAIEWRDFCWSRPILVKDCTTEAMEGMFHFMVLLLNERNAVADRSGAALIGRTGIESLISWPTSLYSPGRSL